MSIARWRKLVPNAGLAPPKLGSLYCAMVRWNPEGEQRPIMRIWQPR
jgi:hypothetical protein